MIYILSQKKKKWIVFASVLLCMVLSLGLSVVRFSWTNLSNLIQNRDCLAFTEEAAWSLKGKGSVAPDFEEDAFTLVLEEPTYINNLLIDGTLEGDAFHSVVLSYVSDADKPEEAVLVPAAEVEVKNGDFYLCVNATVEALRVDLTQPQLDAEQSLSGEAGRIHSIQSITLNPTKLNVHYQTLVLAFMFPLSLALLLVEFFSDRTGYKKMVVSLQKYRCLLYDLVARDIKTKYRRSVLGIFWSVLNPLLMMLVLSAIFSKVFNQPMETFTVYYLTGYIMFNFVSESTNFSMVSIIHSAGLIKKVYIPKIVFPLEKCLFSLVNFGFSLIAAVIVFLLARVQPTWTMLMFFVPVIYLFIFAFGFSLILATMNTFFRDIGYLYGVFVTLWMYLTPIIYPLSTLPALMQSMIRILNPLYHYVDYFRQVTLYGVVPSLEANLVCIAYSLIFLFIGVTVFQKHQNKFIFYV